MVDGFEAKSATPQQLSDAVKHKLNQVESMIKHLTPLNHGAEQHNAEQIRASEEIRNQNFQLELTRTKLELTKLQRETTVIANPETKMATLSTTTATASSADPPSVKPTLKTLQQDPAVQMELTDLMNSSGEPVLLGLTDEEQDPVQQLL